MIDIMARDTIAPIVKIIYGTINELSAQEKADIEKVMPYLQKWHGEMFEESVAASIYSVWQLEFYNTLFHSYISEQSTRISITNNYPFIDFIQKLIHSINADPDNAKYNKLCRGAFLEYKGTRDCAYNMAKALA
jgi:acyl-homoserine lactone acylase PvdQ